MAIKPKKSEKMPTGATVKAVKKGLANAAAKKAASKPSAMGQSAKSHQKDLVNISGKSAMNRSKAEQRKKVASGKKSFVSLDESGYKGYLAEKKTAASFKKSK